LPPVIGSPVRVDGRSKGARQQSMSSTTRRARSARPGRTVEADPWSGHDGAQILPPGDLRPPRGAGSAGAARRVVDEAEGSAVYGPEALEAQAALVERLQRTAEALGGGWWTAPWQALLGERRPLGEDGAPGLTSLIRIGTGHPVSEGFPVIVPFMDGGHLCLDADARDPRVAGFLRGVLLRVLAAMPPGSVRVLAVDGGMLGATFSSLRPLVSAELMKPTAIDLDGMRSVLAEAEEHVRRTSPQDGPGLLLAIATLPNGCGRPEFARLAALAASGGRSGVHLVVCGYPPPVTDGGQTPPRLENTTMLTRAGSEHFLVGDSAGRAVRRGRAGPERAGRAGHRSG
jgi:hypothetical protein